MKQKILIVDDRPENLFALEEFIKEHLDVDVVKANNGNEALKSFLHNNFSLAILDVQMPEMDGYELASYIRSRNESRNTPIVFLSAVFSDEFHVFKGYESGGVDFITKPFNPNLLLNKIRFFIKLKDEQIRREKVENNLQYLISERTKELENAKVEAERANAAKSNFLAIMSHEIRTPMHVVLGMVDLLKESSLNKTQMEYLDTLRQACELLLSIIDDILDISKIEAGKFEMEKVSFELEDLIKNVVNLYINKSSEKGLTIIYKSNLDKLFIESDPVRLRQVLNNLINNAIKFTEKGSISLNVKKRELSPTRVNIRFRIMDTGKGIDPKKKKFLFKPFAQEDSSITRRYGGSGLGLSIVKTIVNNLGGKIYSRSYPGKGTLFSISVDFNKTAPKTALPQHPSILPVNIDSLIYDSKILIVEDGKFNQKVLQGIFADISCNVDIAENGIQAVNLFMKNKYDAVLMDCQMPEMDGYEASMKIRLFEKENNLHERTPIIALTAHAMLENRQKCLDSGMDDFLPKPFTKKLLLEKLGKYLKNKKTSGTTAKKDELKSGIPAAADFSYVNFDMLKNLYADVGTEIYALFEDFIKESQIYKKDIQRFLAENNTERLSRLCHALKGTCSYFGVKDLVASCDLIAHHMDKLSPRELKKEVNKILELLDKALGELESIISKKLLG